MKFNVFRCKPCREFTPLLGSCFEKWEREGENIKIIFASKDFSKENFQEYFQSMPKSWLSFSFEDEKISELYKKFQVNGIPWLVILDGNGKLLENEADSTIEQLGENSIREWKNKI
jgi:hypothetical protein